MGALVLAATGAVAGLGAGLGLLSGSSPAGADPLQECSTTTGVIVAVDFAPWGGDIERGCDSTLTTGYDALHAAGFTTAGDDHDGPAFVCRIDSDPPPSQDPCIDTPSENAYWSYWHADAGQDSWSYSQQGAMSYQPPPGSVDAWVFGASNVAGTTGQPSFTPAQVRATNTAPVGSTPTTTAPTAPTTSAGSSGGAASSPVTSSPSGPGSTASGGPASSTSAGNRSAISPNRSPTTTTATSTIATSTSTSAPQKQGAVSGASVDAHGGGRSSPKIVNASATVAKQPSAGSPLPFVLGAVVVVALCGGATAVALRRRRAAQAQEE